ncbi:MAG: LamG domain-containing protein [Verrucomicrobia bacterium]|nr:LamG domain-containing protein [Verrucomicrobiota bacterium]
MSPGALSGKVAGLGTRPRTATGTARGNFGAALRVPVSLLLSLLLPWCWLLARAETGPRLHPALLGHWKLESDARDTSGHGHHGVNHGVRFERKGRSSLAVFDGRGAWIEIPSGPALEIGRRDFTIAVWVWLPPEGEQDDAFGDVLSQFDPRSRKGWGLRITHHTGVTTSQSNARQVHFGLDDGQQPAPWIDHGRPGNAVLVFALAAYDGGLYAGTCEPGPGERGGVYHFRGGTDWADCGSPAPCNSVSALAEWNGQLYAGVANYRLAGSALPESTNPHSGGKVFRYRGGRSWEDCGQLPGTEAVGGLVVYRGALYASSLYRPAGFFRYEGQKRWTPLPTPGNLRVEAMCVYDGFLFASSYDQGHVFRYDGESWADCGQVGPKENTQTYSFAVHSGRLMVGTWSTGRVYRYGGDHRWEDWGRLGQELEVMGMMVHNGMLYAGTLPQAEVYRCDGPDRWKRMVQLDATPGVKYRRAWTMAEFHGRLFCGTLPSGKVWSFESGQNVTHDRSLPAGWNHLAATREGGRLRLFVGGKPVAASGELSSPPLDASPEMPLKLGFGSNDYLRGRLRDVRWYSHALDPRELGRLVRQTLP